MKTALIRTFLDSRRQALAASAETAKLLDELCRQAPEFCACVLADKTTHATQKAQLLAGLVRSDVDRQQIAQALRRLADAELLQVLDGLRQRRVNCRRARELGLRVLLGHKGLAELAASHRLRLVRLLKHLLGGRWNPVRVGRGRPCSASGARTTSRPRASWFGDCRLRRRGAVAWTVA